MSAETTALVGIFGLACIVALIFCGVRLHRDYRTSRVTLACPFP
jgi:hypothetical protein